ncbi:MAG: lipopolysaccharide assembly protein LapA domain-containing protein [Cyanobacteria bacterium P01_A01_bin.105]
MPLYIIFALVIAFFAILFALQNNNLVTINLLIWEARESLAIVLLATLAIGILIGLLVALPSILKRGWRTSRVKKQAASLEDQLIEKDRQVSAQSRKAEGLRQSYQTLLQSLNLTEGGTGLLSARVLPQTLGALLQQMQLQPLNPQFQTVALLLLQAEQPTETATTLSDPNQLWQSVAAKIQNNLTVDSWLYSNGGGQFMCTLTGFDMKAVGQYAETLQGAITEAPIRLGEGQQAQVDLTVGGVLADREHGVESPQDMQSQAQEALSQAQQRGRNRLRIVKAGKPG